jgi:hypothetical protein
MNLLQSKIDYFEKCCVYLASEFGVHPKLPDREKSELMFKRFGKKTNVNSIGENYIWSYTSYIFFIKQKIRRFNAFKLSWLTSKASFDIWNDREDDWYVWHGKWLTENLLKKPSEEKNINPRNTEDTFRRKFLNTPKGFIICLENTSLYDPQSRFCKMCFKKLDCREVLKANNLKLYEERNG